MSILTQKMLVTGGAGYIGSHTVVEMISAGMIPVVLDNLVNSKRGTQVLHSLDMFQWLHFFSVLQMTIVVRFHRGGQKS